MLSPLRRLWDREISPAVNGLSPRITLFALVGTALLINKRYLADAWFGGSAESRWQAYVAWLLATALLFLLAVRRHDGEAGASALRWWVVGGLLGAAVLVAAMAPTNFSLLATATDPAGLPAPAVRDAFAWRRPWQTPPTQMLLLVWPVMVGAMALGGAAGPGSRRPASPPRPGLGLAVALLGLLGGAFVLSGWGPAGLLLHDLRFDKINWCLLTFTWLLAMPLVSSSVIGETWVSLGGGLGRWRFWLPWVAGLLAIMIPLIVLVAGRQTDFLNYYPMYRQDYGYYQPALHGWGFFIAYQLAYGIYFLAWEFFFRGWLLFGLEPVLGANTILVQTIPFVLMHIGKPGVELHSSLVAGVVLGWLAWRGRSFWPCFLVHWGAAATMDTVALLHLMAPSP